MESHTAYQSLNDQLPTLMSTQKKTVKFILRCCGLCMELCLRGARDLLCPHSWLPACLKLRAHHFPFCSRTSGTVGLLQLPRRCVSLMGKGDEKGKERGKEEKDTSIFFFYYFYYLFICFLYI